MLLCKNERSECTKEAPLWLSSEAEGAAVVEQFVMSF